MTLWNGALAALGMLLVAIALNDVFQAVIVPRATARALRPTFLLWRGLWMLWPRLARLRRDADAREDFLAYFAPFALVAMFAQWVVLLIVGYATILWSMRAQVHPTLDTFGAACYFAGTALLTIGFGDYTGHTGLARLVSLAAGASGLGVVSVTTAYLFSLFGAFQAREQFVVLIGARAGAPPSGIGLLAMARHAGCSDFTSIFRDAQQWAATLMESHLAYPTLAYFRSSHDYESWVTTLAALLDAATLLITTIEDQPCAEARFFLSVGRHAVSDLSRYLLSGSAGNDPLLTRDQFDAACDRLAEARYQLRDRDEAWIHFAQLRGHYAQGLANLAELLSTSLAAWPLDGRFIAAEHVLPHQNP